MGFVIALEENMGNFAFLKELCAQEPSIKAVMTNIVNNPFIFI